MTEFTNYESFKTEGHKNHIQDTFFYYRNEEYGQVNTVVRSVRTFCCKNKQINKTIVLRHFIAANRNAPALLNKRLKRHSSKPTLGYCGNKCLILLLQIACLWLAYGQLVIFN